MAIAAPTVAHAIDAIVEARDHAIRKRLSQGEATLEQLLQSMPGEPDLSDDQRREACHRAVRRLVLKKVVYDVGDKWRMA